MIHNYYTNQEGVPFLDEYKIQGLPLNPIKQTVPQKVRDHATEKGITLKHVPLYAILPSQTHISISQLDKAGTTVKLSKQMRFYADGGSWGNIFNVVAMKKESKDG